MSTRPVVELEVSPDDVSKALLEMRPEDRGFGRAMLALNDRQRMFVIARLDFGCSNARAAKMAGYTGSENYNRVQGFRLAHNLKIQAALLEEARKRVTAGTAAAVNIVMGVMEDDGADDKVRLKAAEMILDRGGMPAVSEHREVADGSAGGRAEKVLRLALLAKLLGHDPRVVLGNLADGLSGDVKLIEQVPDAGADAVATLADQGATAAQPAAPVESQ